MVVVSSVNQIGVGHDIKLVSPEKKKNSPILSISTSCNLFFHLTRYGKLLVIFCFLFSLVVLRTSSAA